jgi:hypothetical protein
MQVLYPILFTYQLIFLKLLELFKSLRSIYLLFILIYNLFHIPII